MHYVLLCLFCVGVLSQGCVEQLPIINYDCDLNESLVITDIVINARVNEYYTDGITINVTNSFVLNGVGGFFAYNTILNIGSPDAPAQVANISSNVQIFGLNIYADSIFLVDPGQIAFWNPTNFNATFASSGLIYLDSWYISTDYVAMVEMKSDVEILLSARKDWWVSATGMSLTAPRVIITGDTEFDVESLFIEADVVEFGGCTVSAVGSGIHPGDAKVVGSDTGGASYGGSGGARVPGVTGIPYGSFTYPTDFGSQTESTPGGGSIFIRANVVHLNGSSVGADGSPYGGTSGGSVLIITESLMGNGTISSNGHFQDAKVGGSGGRIAIYFTTNNFTGTISAYGGGGDYPGGPGTVYLHQYLNASANYTTVIVDNNGKSTNFSGIGTMESTFGSLAWLGDLNETVIELDEIILRNYGALGVQSDQEVTLKVSKIAGDSTGLMYLQRGITLQVDEVNVVGLWITENSTAVLPSKLLATGGPMLFYGEVSGVDTITVASSLTLGDTGFTTANVPGVYNFSVISINSTGSLTSDTSSSVNLLAFVCEYPLGFLNYSNLQLEFTPADISDTVECTRGPSLPQNLFVTYENESSIMVTWAAPFFNGTSSLQSYNLQMKNETGWISIYTGANISYYIEGLPPNTNFSFRVAAMNSDGYYSPFLNFNSTAKLSTPPSAMAISYTFLNRSAITFTWTAPLDNGGYPIDHFLLSFSPDDIFWTNITIPKYERSYTATALQTNTTYYCVISAVNFIGSGPLTNISQISTAPIMCGDGIQDANENCTTCSLDYGPCGYPECVTCGSHGECVKGVCNCTLGWSGPDCSVDNPVDTTVEFGMYNPTTLVQPEQDSSVLFVLSVGYIREIDQYNNVIVAHPLNYLFFPHSTIYDLGNGATVHAYWVELNRASITINVSTFSSDASVPFAGQSVNIAKGSVKYSMKVSAWPFSSITHKLQVGINSESQLFGKDVPSTLDTNLDFSNNLLSYTQTVNRVSLYARFLSTAVIDGKITNVQYNYDPLPNVSSVVVTIPHFWDSMEFDPDFEVLVKIGNTKGVNAALIGGVVGGVVGFALIVGLVVFIFVKAPQKGGSRLHMIRVSTSEGSVNDVNAPPRRRRIVTIE